VSLLTHETGSLTISALEATHSGPLPLSCCLTSCSSAVWIHCVSTPTQEQLRRRGHSSHRREVAQRRAELNSQDQRLSADQVERVLKGDQNLQRLIGKQDFLLLKQTLQQQFIVSLAVYVLAAALCALSIVLFIRHENAKKQLTLSDISLTDSNGGANGIAVDLDSLDVKWSAGGEPEDIKVYLENVQTSTRTSPITCHSTENVVRFSPDNYKSLLANRNKGQNNRLRAVLQTKEETFSSNPVQVAVGVTVLTLVDRAGSLTVAAMIDNSRIPSYDFEAKIVVPGRIEKRGPLSIGPNIPYQFKSIKISRPKELDWGDARGVYFSPDDPRLVRFDWLIDNGVRQ
jgi:hypothetical protein